MSIIQENEKHMEAMRQNIRRLRLSKGWSIEHLSEASGIGQKILISMEADEDFDVQYLFRLCNLYHITPHKMFVPTDS